MSSSVGHAPAAVFLCLLWAPPSVTAGSQLPELPKISLASFAPSVRTQLEDRYKDAQDHPASAEANGSLGMVFHRYEQYEWAAACYERARLLEPVSFRWLYYLGVVRAELGQHQGAVKVLQEALTREPSYLPARLRLAGSLLALGALGESEKVCAEVLKEHPDSALAHFRLGQVNAARRDSASAAKHFQKACELFEPFGAAHYALALVFRDLGESAKAQEHLARYEQVKAMWPPLRDWFLDLVKEADATAFYHLRQGLGLEASGQLEEAVSAFQRALEIDPKSEQAHVNLISLYARMGNAARAEKHYRALLEVNPDVAEGHYNFGVFLVGQSRQKEAATAFRRTIEINPYYAEAHSNLAYLLMGEGKLDQAEEHYRVAIEHKPNLRLAHFQLGRILLHHGRTKEAIQHFQRTLTPEDEDTPGFLYALGAAYARDGERESALRYIREARKRAAALEQTDLLASIEKDLRILEGENKSP